MAKSTDSPRRRRIVGVMGSGTTPSPELAEPLGALIASLGLDLLTGGGGGVMTSVARAFCEQPGRRGISIGVLPGALDDETGTYDAPPGYPNPWIEQSIRTHLPISGERGADPLSRNHINVLTPHAIVALPGGAGTRSEVELALRYGTPVIVFVDDDGDRTRLPGGVPVARSIGEVEAFLVEELGL